ncbi:unnamed protein product, partial [Lymnaea stagnalis]
MESRQLTNSFPERKRFNQRRIKEEFVKPNTDKNEGDSHSKSKTDLDLLKAFDLTLEYGPCIGPTINLLIILAPMHVEGICNVSVPGVDEDMSLVGRPEAIDANVSSFVASTVPFGS